MTEGSAQKHSSALPYDSPRLSRMCTVTHRPYTLYVSSMGCTPVSCSLPAQSFREKRSLSKPKPIRYELPGRQRPFNIAPGTNVRHLRWRNSHLAPRYGFRSSLGGPRVPGIGGSVLRRLMCNQSSPVLLRCREKGKRAPLALHASLKHEHHREGLAALTH